MVIRACKWLVVSVWAVVFLSACGGGGGGADDALSAPEQSQLDGPACTVCRAGYVTGVAATGLPLADAEVRVIDLNGQSLSGRTDAEGRFELDVSGLRGPMLLQAVGISSGQAVVLHSVVRGAEVGQRFIQITPLTELITARVLGGLPAQLLQQARVQHARLNAAALAQAEREIERLVRPALDAAGVGTVDLRLSPLVANGTGLDRALDLLVVDTSDGALRVRAVWQPEAQALLLRPGAADPDPMPAADLVSQAAADAVWSTALPALRARLQAWQDVMADGVPAQGALEDWFSPDLLHAGLNRTQYLQRVVLRQDAAQQGGFSWQGVRFDQLRVLQVRDADLLLLRWRVTPRAPFEAHDETMWAVREGGQWRWRGDGQAAHWTVRHALVLGPAPLSESAVRALPGAGCTGDAPSVVCRIDGGQADVPAGGHLALGSPGGSDPFFGVMAWYRSQAATAEERLQAMVQHSRGLAAPSARVQPYLWFELDARQVHPDAVKAVVTGPGLPDAGMVLVPPPSEAGVPVFAHWGWRPDDQATLADEDWHGVPRGWCGGRDALSCEAGWAQLTQGSRYTLTLLDQDDTELGRVHATVPLAPQAEGQEARALGHFSRWQLAADLHGPVSVRGLWGASQPAGDALVLQLPWQAPAQAASRPLRMDLQWQRAGFPPTFGDDRVQRVMPLAAGAAGGAWGVAEAARLGFRTTWLVLRLTSTDVHGHRYVHALAPSNPY